MSVTSLSIMLEIADLRHRHAIEFRVVDDEGDTLGLVDHGARAHRILQVEIHDAAARFDRAAAQYRMIGTVTRDLLETRRAQRLLGLGAELAADDIDACAAP